MKQPTKIAMHFSLDNQNMTDELPIRIEVYPGVVHVGVFDAEGREREAIQLDYYANQVTCLAYEPDNDEPVVQHPFPVSQVPRKRLAKKKTESGARRKK